MQNIVLRTEGKKLIIEIDLSQEFGLSSSGKSIVIASTQGNVPVPEAPDPTTRIGVNVYRAKNGGN